MFYSESLPKSPGSAAAARTLVERLRAELPESMLEDTRLLVSELVANAVEHPAVDGEIEVRMDLSDTRLRVEVLDTGPGFEWVPRADDAERGWGLHFTDNLSSRWAVERGERTCVWFELDR